MNHEEKSRMLEEIHMTYGEYIKNTARKVMVLQQRHFTKDDLEDFQQEVYLRLLDSGLDKFRGDCSMKTYLNPITKNCVRNDHRKNQRRERDVPLEKDDHILFADARSNFGELLVARIELEEAMKALYREAESLGESYPELFRMIFEEHAKLKEVARALGRSISTVAGMKERLCQEGRRVLSRDFPDLVKDVLGKGSGENGRLGHDALCAILERGGEAWNR